MLGNSLENLVLLLRGVTASLLVRLPVLLLALLVAVGHLGAFAAKTGSSSFVAETASEFSQRNLGHGPDGSLHLLGGPETQHLVDHEFGREILNRTKARESNRWIFSPRSETGYFRFLARPNNSATGNGNISSLRTKVCICP